MTTMLPEELLLYAALKIKICVESHLKFASSDSEVSVFSVVRL